MFHLTRDELGDYPVGAVSLRGKHLQAGDPTHAARSLLAQRTVKVVPVLDGERYVGSVDRDLIAGAPDDDPVSTLATALLPVATAATPTREALQALDVDGGSRLVVVDADQTTYVGLVCLRGDRLRLCVDEQRLGL